MLVLWAKPSMTLFFPVVLAKKKLILDLRHENKCLVKQRVKYRDWKVALAYFTKGSYMFSFDLKSGCHYVEISQHVQFHFIYEFLLLKFRQWEQRFEHCKPFGPLTFTFHVP